MFPTFTATATFRGQTREWTLEVRDGTLEFWDATRDEPDQWRFAVWHPIHARDAATWTREELELLWREAIETERVGRRVEMSDELTLFLREEGDNFVRFTGNFHQARGKGIHCIDRDLFDRPLVCWEKCWEERACKGYEYDFGSALQGLKIPFVFNPEGVWPLKKEPLKLAFTRGDQSELHQVNDWIWKLDPQWIEQTCSISKIEGAGVQIVVRSDKPARAIFGGSDKNWGWQRVNYPRAALWEETLRFFSLQPDPVAHQEDVENGTRVFLLYLGPADDYYNEAYFENDGKPIIQPSFHEQLELRLPLADWLRNRAKLSDERINELLI